ncbi:hypothetical protein SESBI_17607 [Sesbania bispinosa]|nr:hypothetical protein SESBI_17607 [Sesbania bispinosa]
MRSDALGVLNDFLAEQQSHLVADSNAGDSKIALVIRHGLDSEITVLCDAKVSIIMFSSTGKFHEYINPSTSTKQFFDQYQMTVGTDLWSSHYEKMQETLKKLKDVNKNLHKEIRQGMEYCQIHRSLNQLWREKWNFWLRVECGCGFGEDFRASSQRIRPTVIIFSIFGFDIFTFKLPGTASRHTPYPRSLEEEMDKADKVIRERKYKVITNQIYIAFGTKLSHNFSSNENILTIGTQHALDPLTLLKARVNNYGRASVVIKHDWKLRTRFSLVGELGLCTRAV